MAKKPQSHGLSTTRTSGLLPEGTYRFKVVEAEEKEGDAGIYWNFTCECASKPFVGNRIWVNISHSPQARFKADEWLDAFATPEDEEAFMEDFVGQTFRGTVTHRERNEKMQADISSFLPDAKGAASGKTVVAPSKPTKAKAKPKVQYKDEEEDEDEEDEEEEDIPEEDDAEEEEDEEDIPEEEEDADDEEGDEEEEDDEDEEPEPVKPSKKSTSKPSPKSIKPAPKGKLPADVKPKPKYRKPF